MTVEYRLVTDKGYIVTKTLKRDTKHALKGLDDARRDAKRQHGGDDFVSWIETRTVTDWKRHEDVLQSP